MFVNIVTILVLIPLVLLCAWVARRAWRSRRPILRWPGLIVAGLLTLGLCGVLILAVIGFYRLGQRHDNPVASIQVARTPTQVARGEQLAHLCMACHSPNEQLPLSGADLLAREAVPPLGTLYAPNLTPSGNIRDWSDGEVMRAIREGVHKDGRSLVAMPANDFRYLSDEDVQALVAYLRSQPAVGNPTPNNQFNLIAALFVDLVPIQTAQQPVGHVTAPQRGTPAYGKYLVDVMECRGCHGPQLQGRMQAGPGLGPSANLTRIVPGWTEDVFLTFFNTGRRPDGSTVPIITFRDGLKASVMPWNEIRGATSDDDLKAMYSYLHSLKTVPDFVK